MQTIEPLTSLIAPILAGAVAQRNVPITSNAIAALARICQPPFGSVVIYFRSGVDGLFVRTLQSEDVRLVVCFLYIPVP